MSLTHPARARTRTGRLPRPRGPLSAAVIARLRDGAALPTLDMDAAGPYADDLQFALYLCYEMHYRGFDGADPGLEWDTGLIGLREEMDRRFLAAIRADLPASDDSLTTVLDALSVENINGEGASYHLRDDGTWDQFREYFAIRSLYQLKEADPHAWAIPRLTGAAKAAYVAVEFDEYGAGRAQDVHQDLFGDLMEAADLNADYLGYLDVAPAAALAPVNLMSSFGLHRSSRGACAGHFAATEITSPPGAARLLAGLERLDAPESCRHFYREHVIADAVHEQVLRHDVVGTLVAGEPDIEQDVIFGIQALGLVEDRLDDHLQDAWTKGRPAIALD